MGALDWFPPLRLLPLRRTRRRWSTPGRVHLELRQVPAADAPGYGARVEDALGELDAVDWAEVNPYLLRVVVAHDPGVVTIEELEAALERAEAECGADRHGFRTEGPEHPGDHEPIVRDFLALGADVVGLGLSLVGRARRVRPLPIEIDIAALVSVVEGAPRVRRLVERRVGSPIADLALSVANALGQGLAQGPLGPVVDIAHRVSLYGELVARRRVWEQREPELCEKPIPGGIAPPPSDPRPCPVPRGPVETYADRAWFGSLAGFGLAFAITRRMDRAVAALYAGLPKAGKLGREAFAAQLGRSLADRGVLPLDHSSLRILDRVDCLLLEADAVFEDGDDHALRTGAEDVLAAAERAGLRTLVAGGDADMAARLPVDGTVPGGADLCDAVRAEQQDGRVVCLIASGTASTALAAADCAIGLSLPGAAPPWGADLVCADDLAPAFLVLAAVQEARAVSRESVVLAGAGAAGGLLLAFGGLLPGTTQRATTAVNAATAMAIVNGARRGISVTRRAVPVRVDRTPWHALDVDEVLELVGSSPDGLPDEDARRRATPHAAEAPPATQFTRAVVEELANPLTPVLGAGAALSAAVGSFGDAAMVSGVMVLNSIVGGAQRLRADRAIAALVRRRQRIVTVVRAGEERSLSTDDLVVGDVMRLRSGESVPADCRIIGGGPLEVDESSLTGESLPIAKRASATDAALVAERTSMVYEGTSIAAGEATVVVVAVGDQTEARRSVLLGGPPPPSGVEARLRSLTALTIPVSLGAGAGVIAIGMLRGRSLRQTIGAGVSLAVAAVPEGLPLLATVAQLGAARRLSSRGALVRNPRAIEALGRVDVVCADKTGTLTVGHIETQVVSDGKTEAPIDAVPPSLRRVLAVALRATPDPGGERLPHPTDRAILRGAEVAAVTVDDGGEDWGRLSEMPFEPARGFHAVLGATGAKLGVTVKGAPEIVLPRCRRWARPGGDAPLTEDDRASLAQAASDLARRGLRVLALAERDAEHRDDLADHRVGNLSFTGFVGLSDPARDTAAEAIRNLRGAGVDVVMITGDHPSTAEGIAAELDLLDGGKVTTGAEIDTLSDDDLAAAVAQTHVFARVTPAHKVRIVGAFQRSGRAVAMTGDGANDAPAIRLADVGIALGKRSTAAAQDAADLVVVDERIETIVDAVLEGRGLWASVRDAVAVLVGGNLGEIAFTLLGTMVDGTPPLNARQLLLVNLLTDAAPALALALRAPRELAPEALLGEGPEASLGHSLDRAIVWRGLATAGGATSAYIVARLTGTPGRARTVALVALVGGQLGQTLVAGGRSPAVTAAGLGSGAVLAGIVQTPGVSQLFGCRPLGPVAWATGLSAAAGATAGAVVAPRIVEAVARMLRDRVGVSVPEALLPAR
jgi:cation-transporting P-type ATPase I